MNFSERCKKFEKALDYMFGNTSNSKYPISLDEESKKSFENIQMRLKVLKENEYIKTTNDMRTGDD